MRVQLIPVEGTDPPIEVTKDLMLIGRKDDCDIHLDHKSISKQHCVIVKADGLLLLRDLGSTNGTRVNGQRVRRAALLPNDQINIASMKFKVSFTDEDAIGPEEFTQQLDAQDLQKLLKRPTTEADEEEEGSSEEIALPPMQANALPDIYDDDKPTRRK